MFLLTGTIRYFWKAQLQPYLTNFCREDGRSDQKIVSDAPTNCFHRDREARRRRLRCPVDRQTRRGRRRHEETSPKMQMLASRGAHRRDRRLRARSVEDPRRVAGRQTGRARPLVRHRRHAEARKHGVTSHHRPASSHPRRSVPHTRRPTSSQRREAGSSTAAAREHRQDVGTGISRRVCVPRSR